MLTRSHIEAVVRATLDEDAPWGDLTSETLIPADATATADLRRTTVREQAVGRVLVQVKRAGAAASLPNAEAAVPVVRRVPRANGPVLRALDAVGHWSDLPITWIAVSHAAAAELGEVLGPNTRI